MDVASLGTRNKTDQHQNAACTYLYLFPQKYYNKLSCLKTLYRLYCDINVRIQIPLTGYVDFIWRTTTVATASWSTIEGTFRLCCRYCDRSTVHAVAAGTLNGTPIAVALVVLASYEIYLACQEESGCVANTIMLIVITIIVKLERLFQSVTVVFVIQHTYNNHLHCYRAVHFVVVVRN